MHWMITNAGCKNLLLVQTPTAIHHGGVFINPIKQCPTLEGGASLFSLVIAREQRDRGDPVNNKVARIRVRALLTGLLRCTRNDKRVRATRAHPRALFLPLCITIKNRPNGRFFIYADPIF